jgi:hypothetical protein
MGCNACNTAEDILEIFVHTTAGKATNCKVNSLHQIEI